MKNDKRMFVNKIPLSHFIDLLASIEETGANFIDLVVTLNNGQDEIGILIKSEYMIAEEEEEESNLNPAPSITKLTEEDIKKLEEEWL